MPLQNRVDPFSRLHANPARGMFTGNRGILHDEAGQIATQSWRAEQWIICRLVFKDRHADGLMQPGHYTHLFFMDEATALAAGHRPCAECRRADYNAYGEAVGKWRGERPYAPAINDAIRDEMGPVLHGGRHELVDASLLPAGAMYALGDQPYLVRPTGAQKWTFDGYGQLERFPQTPVRRLTPRISIAALEGGFQPVLHATAG